jgi:hypothetical protein
MRFDDDEDVPLETRSERVERLRREYGDRCPQCGQWLHKCEMVRRTPKGKLFTKCRECKTILLTGEMAIKRLAERH